MKVIGDKLAEKLAQKLNCEFISVDRRIFPDGEVNFKINSEDLKDDIILLERKKENENVNTYLVRLYFLTKTLHEAGSKITLVMPYFIYARQDEVFRKGEPLSSQYVADLFDPLIEKFITFTAHTHRRDNIQPLFKYAKAKNISAIPALCKALGNVENAFVLGPDTESIIWSKEMAEILRIKDYGAFKKERDVNTGKIKITTPDYDMKGKNLIIVDDMVSSGGTMVLGTTLAKEKGVKDIYLTFVHPVLVKGALDNLKKLNPKKIISTNTIESEVSKAEILDLLIEELK